MATSKREQMLRVFSGSLKRHVLALLKQVWVLLSRIQSFPDEIKLDSPVVHICGKLVGKRWLLLAPFVAQLPELGQHTPPSVIIHSAPVIRIDQVELPQFISLIGIRDARNSELN